MGDKAEKYAQWIVENKDKKGTPEFETVAKAYKLAKAEQPSEFKQQLNELADIGVGALGEGAKFVGRIAPGITGEEAQAATEKFLTPKGRQLNPEAISLGRIGADIGASYAIPFGLGKVAGAIPQAAKYAELLGSGGMTMDKAATGSKLANALIRGGVGAVEGGATGALINPDDASLGAIVQGSLAAGNPLIGEMFKRGATKLMTSAVKPDISDFKTGAAQRAVNTMLEEGVNPTLNRTIFGRGLDTLETKIGELNSQIANVIANSRNAVSKQDILNSLDNLASKYKLQLASDADIAAIQHVKDQVIANLPNSIPVQLAQKIKQGTYRSLGNKAFGEIGATSSEAQKAGAKSLKEGIAKVEPEVIPLNAKESDLLNVLNVVERKAYAALKNNPLGLAPLANDPNAMAAFLADRSPAFKALLARMMYQTGKVAEGATKLPVGVAPAAIATQGEQ